MKIAVAPFTLPMIRSLRSGDKHRSGFLIRVEFDDQRIGYSCVQPWPELGDTDVTQYLKWFRDRSVVSAKNETEQPLMAGALAMAEWDAVARLENQALLPPSGIATQILLDGRFDFATLDATALFNEVAAMGATTVKLKIAENMEREVAAIETITHGSQLRLRLDANAKFSMRQMLDFWNRLTTKARAHIDFIEDPCPWSAMEWQMLRQSGMSLARDREGLKNLAHGWSENHLPEDILIIKPALSADWSGWRRHLRRGGRAVVTSYLDHALGQVGAAALANKLNQEFPRQILTAGVSTHLQYEANTYANRLQVKNGSLRWAENTKGLNLSGFGFLDLLENERWEVL